MAGLRRKKNGKKTAPKEVTANDLVPEANEALVENDQLLDDLLEQIDNTNTSSTEAAVVVKEVQERKAEMLEQKKDSRSRFEARKARKAAEQMAKYTPDDVEEDARKEREAKDEEIAINKICDQLGLTMYEINPDGHCLFAAVADQLRILGILQPQLAHYGTTRFAASQYIYEHKDDFLPFLPSTEGEDGTGAGNDGFMGPKEFERYCANIRDTGVWGGEPEILALSKAYNVPIHVVQAGKPPIVIHDPSPTSKSDIKDKNVVRISYHRKMYGLGEHYNSLRPKSRLQSLLPIS